MLKLFTESSDGDITNCDFDLDLYWFIFILMKFRSVYNYNQTNKVGNLDIK